MGLVLLLLLPVALAWGPVSHIYFDTKADVPVTNGADLPDGYAGFLSPQFTYAATRCPDTLALHDPVLAAKLYQAAVSGSAPATYVSFLASYMSHMVGDVVGDTLGAAVGETVGDGVPGGADGGSAGGSGGGGAGGWQLVELQT